VAIGLIFSAFFCAVTPYNDFRLVSTYIAGNQFPIGALFVLFFFAFGINPALRRIAPRFVFRSGELLTIWTLILVASGLPSSGLMRYLIPTIAAPQYLSNSSNDWERKVWASTPSWLRLTDRAAADAFAHGYPLRRAHVPWAAWTTPLLFWGILVALFITTTFCFSNLLRKQWIENERFSFPLVTLPVLMAEEPQAGKRLNELFRSPLFWGGVVLTTAYHTQRGLHLLYPTIPDLPSMVVIGDLLRTPPWSSVGWFTAYFYPLVVGIAYLLPTEVCFSLWFFYLFYKLELLCAGLYNFSVPGDITADGGHQFHTLQSFGGGIGLFLWICWTGRRHFRDVWIKARGGPGAAAIDDSREMFSYRATIAGLAISYGGIALWLYAAGASLALILLALVMMTLTLTVISWVVSQAGLLFTQQEYGTIDLLAPTLGTSSFATASLYVTAQFEGVFLSDTREMLAPSVLMGVKTGDAAGFEIRPLFRAMVASVAIGTVIAAVAAIMLPYYNGGADTLNPWSYREAPARPLTFLAGVASTPYPSSPTNWLHVLSGLVGVLGLLIARAQFNVGLHPIGSLVASTYAMGELWGSLFLGWLFKSIIQRYGGMRGFRALQPFFLALVLGDVINAVFWIILGYATKVGYQIMPG